MVDMEDKLEKHEMHDLLTTIQESADSTYKLLENLLLWSRSQQGRIVVNAESIDIGQIILNNMELFKPVAGKKKIKLKTQGEVHQQVQADKNLIDTVVRNLISNAIKFTLHEGTITILVKAQENVVTIKVNDTGVGMSEEVQKNLFGVKENS